MGKKRKLTGTQILLLWILVLYVLNLIEGIVNAVTSRDFGSLAARILPLAIIAFLLYRGREFFKERRQEYLEEMEKGGENLSMKDAAVFSLAYSKEIYNNIPEDRKPLVKISFGLIGIALGIMILESGMSSLLVILFVVALAMAGVNLLIWVVGSERQEKERIQVELETARRMQMSLMPTKDPSIKGFDVSGYCLPAHDVGGDLFDFAWSGQQRNQLCIAVADVSGKGMDAAITAIYTSGAFVSEVQHEADVLKIMKHLNSAVYSRQNRSRFVSMLMVTLDIERRLIHYVNAGQSRPLLLREGAVSVLAGPGARFPLGVKENPDYEVASLQLSSGDRLLLYTDGVTEAMDESQEMFGQSRLVDLFLRLGKNSVPAQGIVNGIKDDILDYSAAGRLYDDLTVVAVSVL
jgi:serine phosphatase RsbU (regulator of sigma subunit)